jgi:hypothetical protein
MAENDQVKVRATYTDNKVAIHRIHDDATRRSSATTRPMRPKASV